MGTGAEDRGSAITLGEWNGLEEASALEAALPCNGSHAWARELVAARPFAREEELFKASDRIWMMLTETDWNEAFRSHPRIGASHAQSASAQSLRWSAGEQAAVGEDVSVQAALHTVNVAYEAKFGRIFLVCATGRSAAEILGILERRLQNEPHSELLEAAEQQRRITQLRLRKWLGCPSPGCDDV